MLKEYKKYFFNKKVREHYFKNNKNILHGTFNSFNEEGIKYFQEIYNNGKITGVGKYNSPNEIVCLATYKDSTDNGILIDFKY